MCKWIVMLYLIYTFHECSMIWPNDRMLFSTIYHKRQLPHSVNFTWYTYKKNKKNKIHMIVERDIALLGNVCTYLDKDSEYLDEAQLL